MAERQTRRLPGISRSDRSKHIDAIDRRNERVAMSNAGAPRFILEMASRMISISIFAAASAFGKTRVLHEAAYEIVRRATGRLSESARFVETSSGTRPDLPSPRANARKAPCRILLSDFS